ncbi:hypothetical protein AK812_SmicGene36978 [Symbiodinium microadriaticum]|uniref:Uncharacterized protein n=1 Tax=Symbiodinium microadriaticum TaxID=2951 RepID=A0A1Q9CHM8_SYMMI|nr:hypothetical protein AK812_SmicGene36978 [Symbiodinium microadriaticum]
MLGVSALQRSIILHSDALINNLRRFHFAVRAYDGFGCGDISNNKTVTFGDECTEDQLNPDYQHSLNFKVVGESFKSHASDVGPTQAAQVDKSGRERDGIDEEVKRQKAEAEDGDLPNQVEMKELGYLLPTPPGASSEGGFRRAGADYERNNLTAVWLREVTGKVYDDSIKALARLFTLSEEQQVKVDEVKDLWLAELRCTKHEPKLLDVLAQACERSVVLVLRVYPSATVMPPPKEIGALPEVLSGSLCFRGVEGPSDRQKQLLEYLPLLDLSQLKGPCNPTATGRLTSDTEVSNQAMQQTKTDAHLLFKVDVRGHSRKVLQLLIVPYSLTEQDIPGYQEMQAAIPTRQPVSESFVAKSVPNFVVGYRASQSSGRRRVGSAAMPERSEMEDLLDELESADNDKMKSLLRRLLLSKQSAIQTEQIRAETERTRAETERTRAEMAQRQLAEVQRTGLEKELLALRGELTARRMLERFFVYSQVNIDTLEEEQEAAEEEAEEEDDQNDEALRDPFQRPFLYLPEFHETAMSPDGKMPFCAEQGEKHCFTLDREELRNWKGNAKAMASIQTALCTNDVRGWGYVLDPEMTRYLPLYDMVGCAEGVGKKIMLRGIWDAELFNREGKMARVSADSRMRFRSPTLSPQKSREEKVTSLIPTIPVRTMEIPDPRNIYISITRAAGYCYFAGSSIEAAEMNEIVLADMPGFLWDLVREDAAGQGLWDVIRQRHDIPRAGALVIIFFLCILALAGLFQLANVKPAVSRTEIDEEESQITATEEAEKAAEAIRF